MTAKIKVNESVQETREVDIDLPHFTSAGSYYFMITDEHKAVCVETWNYQPGIRIVHSGLAFCNNATPCTDEQFYAAYLKVQAKLNELANIESLYLNEENHD